MVPGLIHHTGLLWTNLARRLLFPVNNFLREMIKATMLKANRLSPDLKGKPVRSTARFRFELRGRDRELAAFFAAFVVLSLLYRVILFCSLYVWSMDTLGFDPILVSPVRFWGGFWSDCVAGFMMTAVFALIGACVHGILRLFRPRWDLNWIDIFLGTMLLVCSGLFVLTHYHLVFELQTGLTMSLLRFGWAQFGSKNFFGLIDLRHALFLAVPAASFLILRWWLKNGRFTKLLLACVLAAVLFPFAAPQDSRLVPELRFHPLYFFARDYWINGLLGSDNPYAIRTDLPGSEQMKSIKLIDETFVNLDAPGARPALTPSQPRPKVWNVIWFIMESVGSEYVSDRSFGNEVPMPFLERMAREGLCLTQHRAASNTSARAGFSLFTGIYPPCEERDISTAPDVRLPTINRFLGESYHSFVLTPSSTSFCFPRPVLANNGVKDIYDRDSIPSRKNADRFALARNEVDAMSFFLQKLDEAERPFFATYWSFVPHFPYSNYGANDLFQAVQPEKRREYYKNLRVLDQQLERAFVYLQEQDLLKDTILFFVGDHGESFGQHAGYWRHTLGTFDESYKTPAIFYQPKLFPPSEVTSNTSHVDVLPTLLEAMGIPFNANLLSGESVLNKPNRKYVFTVSGLGDHLSLVSNNRLKVSISFNKHEEAYAYDLAKDPSETVKLRAEDYPDEMEALLKFHNYEARIVEDYDQCLRSGGSFHGQTLHGQTLLGQQELPAMPQGPN